MGMLVLARRNGESLMIGDDIRIMVVGTGEDVRLAIDAPKNVPILRSEIYDEMKAAGQQPKSLAQ